MGAEALRAVPERLIPRKVITVGRLSDVSSRLNEIGELETDATGRPTGRGTGAIGELNDLLRFNNRFYAGPQQVTLQADGTDGLSLYDRLLPFSNEQRILKAVLASGQRLEPAFGRELTFPQFPSSIDAYNLKKAGDAGMTLLAIPEFPLKTRDELQQEVERDQPSPILNVYGKSYLTSVLQGEVPILSANGGYALIDSPKGELAAKLAKAAGDMKTVHTSAPERLQEIIDQKGEEVLIGMGFKSGSGARIVVATAEMLLLHKASGYEGDFGEGITSTKVRGTDSYLVLTGDKFDAVDKSDLIDYGIPPRLAIVFSKPEERYLKPLVEKAAPVVTSANATEQTGVDSSAVTVFTDPVTGLEDPSFSFSPRGKLGPLSRLRRKRAELAPKS